MIPSMVFDGETISRMNFPVYGIRRGIYTQRRDFVYFQQFYLTCLSHASYMLGSDGVACVVDPQRDVELYLEEAAKQNLRIQHIIETHLHADFVIGHHELAYRTAAHIYLCSPTGA